MVAARVALGETAEAGEAGDTRGWCGIVRCRREDGYGRFGKRCEKAFEVVEE